MQNEMSAVEKDNWIEQHSVITSGLEEIAITRKKEKYSTHNKPFG